MPQSVIEEVACDHLVYFGDPAGLQGLSAAVVRALESDHGLNSASPSSTVVHLEVATAQPSASMQASTQTLSGATAQEEFPKVELPESLTQSREGDESISVSRDGQNWHRWWLAGLGILAVVLVAVVVFWPRRSQMPQSQPQSQLNTGLLFPKGVSRCQALNP